jgi:hypothetical protein
VAAAWPTPEYTVSPHAGHCLFMRSRGRPSQDMDIPCHWLTACLPRSVTMVHSPVASGNLVRLLTSACTVALALACVSPEGERIRYKKNVVTSISSGVTIQLAHHSPMRTAAAQCAAVPSHRTITAKVFLGGPAGTLCFELRWWCHKSTTLVIRLIEQTPAKIHLRIPVRRMQMGEHVAMEHPKHSITPRKQASITNEVHWVENFAWPDAVRGCM